MPLINCKIHLELNWTKDCILSSVANFAKFKIADVKDSIDLAVTKTRGLPF